MGSRLSNLVLSIIVLLSSTAAAKAEVINGIDEASYTNLLGPNTYRSPLVGTKTATESLSVSPAPQEAQLYIINGSGDDLSPSSCNELPLFRKIACTISNAAKFVRLNLERPKQIEISLNGQVLITQAILTKTTNSLLLPITLQSANQLRIKLKGSIFSYIQVSVRSSGVVNNPPVALLAVSKTGGLSPLTTQFDASLSNDPEGQPLSYIFSFGDGTSISSTTPIVEHTYNIAGTFTTTVRVNDPEGLTSTSSPVEIQVIAPIIPVAKIEVDRTDIMLGQSIVLSGQSSQALNDGATIVKYEWTLPNGNVIEGANRTVTLSQTGIKTIFLKVTDSLGFISDSVSVSINVRALEKPIAHITLLTEKLVVPTVVQVDSTLSTTSNLNAEIIGTRWRITSSNGTDYSIFNVPSPTIPIDTTDTYTISLEVRDSLNQVSDPVTRTFTATNTLPIAHIAAVSPDIEPAVITFDGSQSYDPDGHVIVHWQWTFSDGLEFYGPNPQRSFFFPGEYTVTLRVLDEFNAWSTPVSATVQILSNQAPTSTIVVQDVPGSRYQKTFNGSGSADSDGTITGYYWWILGQQGTIHEGPEFTYTFPSAGEFDVYLDVYDDRGLRGTSSVRISIQPGTVPPIAKIRSTQSTTVARQVSLSASQSSDDGLITTYRWDLSDGTTLFGENVTHTFSESGFYDVSLTATDEDGLSGVQQISIQTIDQSDRSPTAVITGKLDENHLEEEAKPTEIVVDRLPAYIELSAHASDIAPAARSNSNFAWQAGALGTFEGESIRLRVNRTGEFPVTLQVTDGSGRTSTSTTLIKSQIENCFQYDGDNICPSIVGTYPDVIDLTGTTVVISTNQPLNYDPISLANPTAITLESKSGQRAELSSIATFNASNIEIPASALASLLEGFEEPLTLRVGLVSEDLTSAFAGGLNDLRVARRQPSVRLPSNAKNLIVSGSASGIEIRLQNPPTILSLGSIPFDTYAVSVLTENGDLSRSFEFSAVSTDVFDLTTSIEGSALMLSNAKSSSAPTLSMQSVSQPNQFSLTNVIPFGSHMPGYPKSSLSNQSMNQSSKNTFGTGIQTLAGEPAPSPYNSWCGHVSPFPVISRGPNTIPVDRTYGKFISNNLNTTVDESAKVFTPVSARSVKEGKIAGYCQLQSPTYIGAQFYNWMLAANRSCCKPEHGPNCLGQQNSLYSAQTAGQYLESANIQFIAEFQNGSDTGNPIRSWSTNTSFQAAAAKMGYRRATMSSTLGLPIDGNVEGWAVPFRFEIPVPSDMAEPNVRVNVNSSYPHEFPGQIGSHFYYCWIETGPHEVLFDLKIGAQHNTTTNFTVISQNNARASMRDERLIPATKDDRTSYNFFTSADEKWQYSPLFKLSARGTFDQAEFNSANIASLTPQVTVVVAGDSVEYDVGGPVTISNYNCPTSGNCYGQLNFDGGRIFENVPQFAASNRLLSTSPTIPGITLRYKVFIANNGKNYDAQDTATHKLNYDLAPEAPAVASSNRLENSDSYMCGLGYSEKWSTYGKLKLANFVKDGLMHMVRNSDSWLLCNDGAYPFGSTFAPHGAHQLGQNLDVRPFNSDPNFANTFHQGGAAKKMAAYSLLRAYRVAIDSWPCVGDENTECVTPIGAVRKSREYCWKNLDKDEAFTGTNCPMPQIPPLVTTHYTHATRRQAIDDISKYIKGMRDGLEVLMSPGTPQKPSELIHSDGALDNVATIYANVPYLLKQSVPWNLTLLTDGELHYRRGPPDGVQGPAATISRVPIYRNGIPILTNACSQIDSRWRIGAGCSLVIPKSKVEGVYDAQFLNIQNIPSHLDHIHIEVYD